MTPTNQAGEDELSPPPWGSGGFLMATSLTENIQRREDWSEPGIMPGTMFTRAELAWTLFGIALLVAFVFLVIEDYPLRSVLAAH